MELVGHTATLRQQHLTEGRRFQEAQPGCIRSSETLLRAIRATQAGMAGSGATTCNHKMLGGLRARLTCHYHAKQLQRHEACSRKLPYGYLQGRQAAVGSEGGHTVKEFPWCTTWGV
jgi:hypothetical protein